MNSLSWAGPRFSRTADNVHYRSTRANNLDGPFCVTLDLFERPLHLRHLAACVEARQQNPGWGLKTLACQLGISNMTVKRALDCARRLEGERIEPYQELTQRPRRASRWQL